MCRDNENGERVAVPHLFATGERNSDGFIAQSIRIRRQREDRKKREGGERGRESVAC